MLRAFGNVVSNNTFFLKKNLILNNYLFLSSSSDLGGLVVSVVVVCFDGHGGHAGHGVESFLLEKRRYNPYMNPIITAANDNMNHGNSP